MMMSRKELRALPTHDLIDLLESTYLHWRYEDRGSALEGSLAVYFHRVAHEVERRRRRAVVGSCSCEICTALLWDGKS